MSGALPELAPLSPEATQALLRAPQVRRNQPGWLGAGLNVGWQNFVGTGGSALEALGRATDIGAVERYGRSVADYRDRRAQEVGRADLATPPWREGGASILPWLGYNVAQQLPNFATTAAAYIAGGPSAAAAAAGSRGFGLRAGLNAVARATGASPGGVAAAGTMLPQAAGSMYREAVESARARTGDEDARPSVDNALAALGLSPIYAAAEAIPTGRLLDIGRGAGWGAQGASRAARTARGVAQGAATEFVTEGVQSGMEQAFRPDLSIGERAANVVDGALTGMAVGGVMGGGAGLLSRRRAIQNVTTQDPMATPTEDIATAVDQALNPTPMTQGVAATAAQPDLFGAPTQMMPVEGTPRETPAPAAPENELPLPGLSDNPLLAEPGVPALPLERSRDPDAGGLGREIALDTPNIIRQALQAAGANVRDNQDFRRFIGQFQAQDEVGLAREVQERLNDRNPSKRLMALAEGLGFFDREGQPRDFAAEMTAARTEAEAALAARNVPAARQAAAKIESIQRAERIQAALAEPVARPEAPVAPAPTPLTEMPVAAARQAVAEAAAQPVEQAMSALPLEWARPISPPTTPEAAPQQAAAPPIDPARMVTTPGQPGNAVLAEWAKQPRVAAALVEGNPLISRMAEVATIAGVKKQDATLARKWLERFESRGAVPPDQQASAERLLARVYQAGGADAVQVGRSEGVDVREPPPDGPQVGEGNPEGQGAPAPRAEEAPAAQPAVVRGRRSPAPALEGGSRSPAPSTTASPSSASPAPVAPVAPQIDEDAAQVDAQGVPVASPEQAIRLTPDERMKLSRVAQSPLLSDSARRAALDAMNNPTRGKVDATIASYTRVLNERMRAQRAAQVSPLAARLREIARSDDPRVSTTLKDAASVLADEVQARRPARGKPQSRAYKRALTAAAELAKDYQRALERYQGPPPPVGASRKPRKQTQADRIAMIREAAARAGILRERGDDTTLARLREPLPTRRGVLAAAVSGALGTQARAQTARAIEVLKTGDIAGALDVIAEQSSNTQLRDLARRLAPLMGEVEVRIVEVGRTYPPGYVHPALHSAYGLVSHNPATGQTTMHVRVDPGAPDVTNTTDETIVHEAIHAAILSRLGPLERYGAFMSQPDAQTMFRQREGVQARPGDEHILQILRLWRTFSNALLARNDWRQQAQRDAWLREPATTPDEFVTYALTSPEFQAWMKQQSFNREGFWTRFVRAVGGFLGFGARRPTFLEATLDASNALFDVLGQVQQGPTEQFSRQRRSDLDTGEVTFARLAPAVATAERTAARIVSQAGDLLNKAKAQMGRNMGRDVRLRAATLYLTTLNHIARTYGRLFPVSETFQHKVDDAENLLENITNINRRRATISAKFAELFTQTWNAQERMPEGQKENLRWLMEVTAYKIDPRKTWAEHTWLQEDKRADWYKDKVAEANRRYNAMKIARDGGKASDVFDNLALHNLTQRYASMTTLIYNTMRSSERYRDAAPEGFAVDPMAEFLSSPRQVQNTLADAHTYWRDAFERTLTAAEALWRQQYDADKNQNNSDPTTWTRLPDDARPTNKPDATPDTNLTASLLRDMRTNAQGLTRHPYFHLGRVGDYFASFNIKPVVERVKGRAAGAPDPAAAERVVQAMKEGGFDDVTIPLDAEKARVFMRLETPEQLAGLLAVLRKLEAEGHIEDGSIKRGHRDEPEGIAAADAKFLERAVERFRTSPAFSVPEGMDINSPEAQAIEAAKARAVSQLREAWLNMLPATSEARILTQRQVISGWSKHMMDSYAFRANVGALALANQATSAPMTATLSAMRTRLRDMEGGPPGTLGDTLAAQQVMQETLTRETNQPMTAGRDWIDSFRAVNYAYFLGLSPAYALNNLTQVYVTLWPELSKRHGVVASAKEIAKSTGLAIKVMRAAISQGFETSSQDEPIGSRLRRATEPDITARALETAGVPQEMQPYIMRLVNTGVVDIGAAARELSRLAARNTNKRLDNVLRLASSFGLYTEAAVRLASGMALYNMEKAKRGAKFDSVALVPEAVRLIDDTMFNYTEANVGRALGRQGVFGRATPITTAFQQFNAQMLEKLVREFDDLVGAQRQGETAEARTQRRKEARRFLGTHMAAITVLAGSLGIPGVTAIAAAANAAKDLLDDDDEPYDMVAAWRNFLADVLGRDVGEVVARGLPRAIGADTSTRLGEQDIIPFSRFFADRRRWEDAVPDQAERMLGAPFSMVGNVVVGMREVANGNILAGMQRALPTALRSFVATAKLAEEGYTNPQGVRLPIGDPGASAYLSQVLGYRPAAQAEYAEANMAQAQRRGIITRDAARIRGQLLKALEAGDQESARDLIARAREFDANNPAYAILPRLGSALQARILARTRADALDVPLGVSLRDVAARDRTAFANY